MKNCLSSPLSLMMNVSVMAMTVSFWDLLVSTGLPSSTNDASVYRWNREKKEGVSPSYGLVIV